MTLEKARTAGGGWVERRTDGLYATCGVSKALLFTPFISAPIGVASTATGWHVCAPCHQSRDPSASLRSHCPKNEPTAVLRSEREELAYKIPESFSLPLSTCSLAGPRYTYQSPPPFLSFFLLASQPRLTRTSLIRRALPYTYLLFYSGFVCPAPPQYS